MGSGARRLGVEIGERHDSVWEPVNEDASVNGTDKGVSGGEAEVADTKATEAAEPPPKWPKPPPKPP